MTSQLPLFAPSKPSSESFECLMWDSFLAYPAAEVPDTTLSVPERKWRAISAYQKAIRRSDPDTAVKCAVAVYRSEPDYFFRRNAIVMFEDIGPADLDLCVISLLMYQRRKTLGTHAVQLIANFARAAALAMKDRALCWTAVSSWFPRESFQRRLDLAQQNLADPLAVFSQVVDDKRPIVERYQALLALYGKINHRLDPAEVCKQQPRKEMALSSIAQLSEAAGWPQGVLYAVSKGASLGLEGLPFALPFVFEAAKFGKPTPMDIPPPVTICGVPSYAFDKHVLEGRRALSRMTYRTGVKDWMEEHQFPLGKYDVTGVLAFEYEGGNILHNWLAYPESEALLVTARAAHLESAGVSLELAETSGKQMFLAALPKLNECRMSEASK